MWGVVAAALFASPEYVGSIGVARAGAFHGERLRLACTLSTLACQTPRLFAPPSLRLASSGDATLLGAAAVGCLAIVGWVCATSSLLFLSLQRLGLLRVRCHHQALSSEFTFPRHVLGRWTCNLSSWGWTSSSTA